MLIQSKCIFDSVGDLPFEGYVLTDKDRIQTVGQGAPSQEIIQSVLNRKERILDVGDQTVMAGFCDNHVHIFFAALALATCNVSGVGSEGEAASRLFNFYKDRDDEWVIGFGWSHYDWEPKQLPTKKSLDRYFPDRPVMVVNDELHALWVNSKAMNLCGIDRTTEDPEYGKILRDEKGEPTGYVLEQSAMVLFMEKALDYSREQEKTFIKAFIEKANREGVTSVGDMELAGVLKEEVCKELENAGVLKVRTFFSPSIRKPVEEFLKLKEVYRSDNLSLLGAKGFIDGTPLGYTGMLVDEYADRPGFFGEPVLDLGWLKKKICELNQAGIPVRLHACGDGAVQVALDDIEAAGQASSNNIEAAPNPIGKTNIRNTIEHIENIHPDDIDRLAATNTIASIQPYHMSMDCIEDHPIFEILGEERCKLAWPAKTLSTHGAHVALGTDCPIVPLDPFQTLYTAINRVMEDGTPVGGWNPQEKYDLPAALKGVTKEPAYLFGKDDKIGTLEADKYADIIVLSENIFDKDPLEIRDLAVVLTMWNGEVVFEKEA